MKGLRLPADGSRVRLWQDGALVTVVSAADARNIGRIELGASEHGILRIEKFCIESTSRGYGAGSEAFHLLFAAMEGGPWRGIRARAPAGSGLAAYFWMRMGFRPVFGSAPGGGIEFECRSRRAAGGR